MFICKSVYYAESPKCTKAIYTYEVYRQEVGVPGLCNP
jgi:hypothetical protein